MRSHCGAWPRPSGSVAAVSVAAVSDERCSPSHGSRSLGRVAVGLLGPTPARTPLYDATGWSTLEDWEIYANDHSAQFRSRRPDPVSCARTPTRCWWLSAGIAAVMRTSSAASSTTRSQRTRPPWIHSHALPNVTRRGEPGPVSTASASSRWDRWATLAQARSPRRRFQRAFQQGFQPCPALVAYDCKCLTCGDALTGGT